MMLAEPDKFVAELLGRNDPLQVILVDCRVWTSISSNADDCVAQADLHLV
jgi:hypothetical protein